MDRLRVALDELTAGAEPSDATVTPLSGRRPRRWLVPTIGAAAVALLVGVAVAFVARDDNGGPAAPTPTGPPVTPTPTSSKIPWYGLQLGGETAGSPPTDIAPGGLTSRVWATPDYSRVLVASAVLAADAAAEPDDWPVIEPIPDPPAGVAWWFSGDDPAATWHGIYWAPDDETAVVVAGAGFTPDDLATVLTALQIEHAPSGPTVVSTLSSLIPVPIGAGLYTSTYPLDGSGNDIAVATISVAPNGPAGPLSMYAPSATSISPATTPHGMGFRMEIEGQTHVWWQVDGGPFWAGLAAPTDRIDDLLTRLVRVADIAAPGPITPPVVEPSGPPATVVVPCTAPSPHALATFAPTSDGALPTTTTSTTVVPCALEPTTTLAAGPGLTPTTTTTTTFGSTSSAVPTSWDVNEPAMTAFMPSPPPDGGRPPIAVGESVMLSAAQELGDRGITVYGGVAIQAVGIADELERLRDIDAFGDAVIIHPGTNGSMQAADLDRIMAAVADVERVVVLTAHADRSWIAPNNELIRTLPHRYSNVEVLDWDALATTCDCLTPDGIHVEDGDVYADAIASAAGLD